MGGKMKRILIALLLIAAPVWAADLTQIGETKYSYLTHGGTQRPWGYELGVAIFDTDQPVTVKKDPDYEFGYRHVRGLTLGFKQAPKALELQARLDTVLPKVAAELAEPVKEPEKTYSESEIVAVLVQKKYLAEGQKLEDLAAKEETVAEGK
jgi:hypothetical protein